MFDVYVYTGLNLADVPSARISQKQRYSSLQFKAGGLAWHEAKKPFEYDLHGLWRRVRNAKRVLIVGPDPWLIGMELQRLGVGAQLYACGNLTPHVENTPNRAVHAWNMLPSGAGGPKLITDAEIALRYTERDNPLLTYAKVISPRAQLDAVLTLISIIKEPRWFVTNQDPYGLNALLTYLGLAGLSPDPECEAGSDRRFAGLVPVDLLRDPYRQRRAKAAAACVNFEELLADIFTPSIDPLQERCLLTSVAYTALQKHGEEFARYEVARTFTTLLVQGWFTVSLLQERSAKYNEFVDTKWLTGIVAAPLCTAFFDRIRAVIP